MSIMDDTKTTLSPTCFRDLKLQIIPDDLFDRVQRKRRQPRGGRKGKKSGTKIPKILNGRVFCPEHGIALQCNGMSGGVMQCSKCKTLRDKDRALYTYLSRPYGTEVLLKGIADATLQAENLAPLIVEACKKAELAAQQQDPRRRIQIQEKMAELRLSIKATLRSPGKTPEQIREIDQEREEMQSEQAELQQELAELHKASTPKRIPTTAEVRSRLKELRNHFEAAAQSLQPQNVADLNRLIDLLTGGKIILQQCGERVKRRGWLEGKCPFRLKQYLLHEHGFESTAGDLPTELHFNFRMPREKYRNPPKTVADTQRIFELYVSGKTEQEIIKATGFSRSTVARHINMAYKQRGLKRPSLKERYKQFGEREDKQPKYKRIAPAVLAMIEEDVDRGEIANRLQTSWTTLLQSIKYLRSQGHSIPDGRFVHSGRKRYKTISPPINGANDGEEKQK